MNNILILAVFILFHPYFVFIFCFLSDILSGRFSSICHISCTALHSNTLPEGYQMWQVSEYTLSETSTKMEMLVQKNQFTWWGSEKSSSNKELIAKKKKKKIEICLMRFQEVKLTFQQILYNNIRMTCKTIEIGVYSPLDEINVLFWASISLSPSKPGGGAEGSGANKGSCSGFCWWLWCRLCWCCRAEDNFLLPIKCSKDTESVGKKGFKIRVALEFSLQMLPVPTNAGHPHENAGLYDDFN